MNSLYDVFGYMSKLHQMILAMLERADHALDALSGVIGISKDCSINSLKHSYHEMKETAPIPSTKSALFSVMPNWSLDLGTWSASKVTDGHVSFCLWNQQVWSPTARCLQSFINSAQWPTKSPIFRPLSVQRVAGLIILTVHHCSASSLRCVFWAGSQGRQFNGKISWVLVIAINMLALYYAW